MNISFLGSGLLAAVTMLSGCASVTLPPEAASVTLVPVSSRSVEIHRPRFKVEDGTLKLEAYALRQWKAETTANTHVDLVCLDGSGRTLAIETTNFHPRSLPATMRRPAPHAYLLILIALPSDTRAIEVRAHDGPHEPSTSMRSTSSTLN